MLMAARAQRGERERGRAREKTLSLACSCEKNSSWLRLALARVEHLAMPAGAASPFFRGVRRIFAREDHYMARSNARISCAPAGGWSDLMIESSISAQPLAVALAARLAK